MHNQISDMLFNALEQVFRSNSKLTSSRNIESLDILWSSGYVIHYLNFNWPIRLEIGHSLDGT